MIILGRIPSSPSVFTSDEYRAWLSRTPSTSALYEQIRATTNRPPRYTYSAENIHAAANQVKISWFDKKKSKNEEKEWIILWGWNFNYFIKLVGWIWRIWQLQTDVEYSRQIINEVSISATSESCKFKGFNRYQFHISSNRQQSKAVFCCFQRSIVVESKAVFEQYCQSASNISAKDQKSLGPRVN